MCSGVWNFSFKGVWAVAYFMFPYFHMRVHFKVSYTFKTEILCHFKKHPCSFCCCWSLLQLKETMSERRPYIKGPLSNPAESSFYRLLGDNCASASVGHGAVFQPGLDSGNTSAFLESILVPLYFVVNPFYSDAVHIPVSSA